MSTMLMDSGSSIEKKTDNKRETLERTIGRLRTSARRNRKLSNEELNELVQISQALSGFLPKVKDESLFEIDDLLFPKSAASTAGMFFQEDIQLKSGGLITLMSNILDMLPMNKELSKIMWTTYLQLIDNSSELKCVQDTCRHIVFFVCHLLSSRNLMKICFALKIMRVAIPKNRERFLKIVQDYRTYVFADILELLLIYKLENIPNAEKPNKKRVTSWMSKQSGIIVKLLNLRGMYENFKFQKMFCLDEFLSLFMKYPDRNICCRYMIDELYDYFMSPGSRDDKIKFLHLIFDKVSERQRDLELIRCLVFQLGRFESHLQNSGFMDDRLKEIDNYHGIYSEPYLNNNPHGTTNVVVGKNSLKKHDFTIEKFLVFDNFQKGIYLINIIYEEFIHLKLKELKGAQEGYIFRTHKAGMCVQDALNDPSKRGNVSWTLQTLIRRCPFMFLPECDLHLNEDLLKLLEGEEVDEGTLKLLSCAINSVEHIGWKYR